MRKEEIVGCVGIVRKIVLERRKVTRIDYNLIVNNLNLFSLSIDEIGEVKVELDDYIDNKLNYFYRRNNKVKIEEYKKIKFLLSKIFELFLKEKSEKTLKSQ